MGANKSKACAHESVGNFKPMADQGGEMEAVYCGEWDCGWAATFSPFITFCKYPTPGFANTCAVKCSISGITRIGATFTDPH